MPGLGKPAVITRLEARVPDGVAERLGGMGHEVEFVEAWSTQMGHGHAIEIVGAGEDRSFVAAADPRSEGSAAAF